MATVVSGKQPTGPPISPSSVGPLSTCELDTYERAVAHNEIGVLVDENQWGKVREMGSMTAPFDDPPVKVTVSLCSASSCSCSSGP